MIRVRSDNMPRQGLSKESVVQAAVDLIEEKGVSQFSMGKLAQRLKIKPASLGFSTLS